MTDRDAFLTAIRATPGDDTPRLVYADWLDDHAGSEVCGRCHGEKTVTTRWRQAEMDADEYGYSTSSCDACSGTGSVPDGRSARAAFIRVQCRIKTIEAAGVGDEDCGDGRAAELRGLRRRERALLTVGKTASGILNGAAWAFGDRPESYEMYATLRPVFTRGFVARVALVSPELTSDLALRLGECCVGLEAVRLADMEPYWNGAGWCWFQQGRAMPSHTVPAKAELPDDLFGRVLKMATSGRSRYAGFTNQPLALSALSAAAAQWCHHLAGYPAPTTSSATRSATAGGQHPSGPTG